MRRVCSAFFAPVLILGVSIITLALWRVQARAASFDIVWLDMSVMTNGTTVAKGYPVQSGSVFNFPGSGQVTVTYAINVFDRTRDQLAAAQNSMVKASNGDKYSWAALDELNQVNPRPRDSNPLYYDVTYTFTGSGPVPPGQLVLGVSGLGRLDSLYGSKYISTITVNNKGTFLGDKNLGPKCGPTLFTPLASGFELRNSLYGNGVTDDPSFNTHLGVVRIDDPVSVLTLRVHHIGYDGFGFTVGRIVHDSDAWIQDKRACDDGSEPDPCPAGTSMWESDDILVRNSSYRVPSADLPNALSGTYIHQNPIHGQTNYVYVKLRNRGNVPVTGTLHLYWFQLSLAKKWDEVNQVPFGGAEIGGGNSVTVGPSLPETVTEFEWNTPQTRHNFGLLVRFIASPYTADPMAFSEGLNSLVFHNAWNNNNIALKNLVVIMARVSPEPAIVEISAENAHPLPETVDLDFNAAGGGTGIPFLDGGSVRVVLASEMFANWMGAGGQGQGIIVNLTDSSISLTGLLAKIQGIPMGADEAQPVTMYFTAGSGSPTPTFQRFVVSQFSDGQTTPDGGVTFEFRSSTAAIPTLSEWGAIIFGLLLLVSCHA